MNLGALKGSVRPLFEAGSPLRRRFEELAENLLSRESSGFVVVTGPERGAGCTSVCLGLGAALASMGRRAAVVDCNLAEPQLHRMLGEPNFVGLTSALAGEKPLEHYGHEAVPGLLVVPTGPVPADPDSQIESQRFVEVVSGLRESREVVLLDAPVAAGVLDSAALSHGFDGVLLVVHATRTAKRLARETTDSLLEAGVNLIGVVLNGVPEGAERRGEGRA